MSRTLWGFAAIAPNTNGIALPELLIVRVSVGLARDGSGASFGERFMHRKITIAAVLTAIAIIIPMFMPIKIIIPPASYTLGSHVPIFVACFISPLTAFVVCVGATLGFLFAGFPLVIVARAASQLIFALVMAFYIKKARNIKISNMIVLSVVISIIHALGEALVVQWLLFPTAANAEWVIWVLVGFGTFVHSMIDFWIAWGVLKGLRYAGVGIKRKS